ncbi:hypothetical protein F4809DRAFT_603261 [Biscogniauxia mediterranea]|nr:hypothetical protein F4809DRAFT_603261 [Biscogniauxia mediterranea]
MHVTLEEAEASGLFGYREIVTLVNVRDSGSLARFRQFYQTHSLSVTPDSLRLLEMLSRPEGVEEYVQYEMEDMQDMWLVKNYMHDPYLAQNPEQVRLVNLIEDKDEGERAFWDMREWHYDTPPIRPFRCARESAWARERLAEMPDFELLIMFNLCRESIGSIAETSSENTESNSEAEASNLPT